MTEAMLNGVDRDLRLTQVLDTFLAALHAGTPPEQSVLLAQHPDLAEELRECLASLAFIRQAAQPAEGSGEEPAPKELGDFRLVREIGRGGMGVVYEAQQLSLSRRVALKVLPFAATMDPRQLQRFHNEALAAAHLDHPHIVDVYGVGCERSVHFYAMRYIEGHTLAEIIDQLRSLRGQEGVSLPDAVAAVQTRAEPRPSRRDEQTGDYTPQPAAPPVTAETAVGVQTGRSSGASRLSRSYFRSVAELGAQVAEALDHAHQLGVVHRDIKPGNLMLDARGKVWITDFGLARLDSSASLTVTGDLVGTLRYMSPEQALAKRVTIDHRSDVYSLGATLYELLTLHPAFGGGDRQELLRQIAFEEPRPARRLCREVPAELETIVLKAMEKNPAERYATAAELAEDLRHFLADKPIRARRPGLVQRLRKWGRRHRGIVTAAGIGLALAVAALVASVVAIAEAYRSETAERIKAQEAGDEARKAQGKEAVQRRAAVKERDAAEYRLYVADMRLAQQAWEGNEIGNVKRLLEAHRPRAGRADPRGWEWYYLQSLCHSELATFAGGMSAGTPCIAWSQGGRFLAWRGGEDGTIQVWDGTVGQKPRTISAHRGGVCFLAWSPDGTRLASAGDLRDDGVRVWDPQTGRALLTLSGSTGQPPFGVAWSPDSRRLAIPQFGGFKVWDTVKDKESLTLGALAAEHPLISWSPEGTRLAAIDDQYSYAVFDATTGRKLLTLPAQAPQALNMDFPPVWSPDGKRLLLRVRSGVCKVFDAVNGGEVFTLGKPQELSYQWRSWGWSPDGTRIATGDWASTSVWDAVTGKELFKADGTRFHDLAWSADGRRLALLGSNAIEVWDVSAGKPAFSLRGHESRPLQLAWDPSGRRLASIDITLTVKVWDTTRSQDYLPLGRHAGPIGSVAWRPDGRRLASRSPEGVKVWDPDGHSDPVVLKIPGDVGGPITWSPDGRRLAFTVFPDTDVRIWDPETGKELLVLRTAIKPNSPRPGMAGSCPVAWNPRGNLVAAPGGGDTVRIWEVSTGREVVHLGGDLLRGSAVVDVAWDPKGRFLATTTGFHVVRVWDTTTWQERTPLPGAAMVLAWSRDGLLAAGGGRSPVRVWDPASGKECLSVPEHSSSLSWSPDGRRLASVWEREPIKVWDAVTGEELLRLKASSGQVAWAPDGQRLASLGIDGRILVWDASPGHHVREMTRTDRDPSQRSRQAEEQKGLALALKKMKRFTEAEAAIRQALAMQEELVEEFPRASSQRRVLADLLRDLGELLEEAGRGDEAEAPLRRAVLLQEEILREVPPPNLRISPNPWVNPLAELRLLLAERLTKAGRHREAMEECRQLINEIPVRLLEPQFLNYAGWRLAVCPDPEVRDPATAVVAAQAAWEKVNRQRGWPIMLKGEVANTLGVAHYRNGDSKAAVEILNNSVQLRNGGASSDFFFLAMAHWRLGEKTKAKEWYDKGAAWMEKQAQALPASGQEELKRFRAEAAELLGVSKPLPMPKGPALGK